MVLNKKSVHKKLFEKFTAISVDMNGSMYIFSVHDLKKKKKKKVLGAWQTPFCIQTFGQGSLIQYFTACPPGIKTSQL